MIGIDTNVLVRALVADDPAQTELARSLFARAETVGAAVFVPVVVIVETEWVLRSVYRFSRDDIAAALGHVCASDHMQIESAAVVERALRAFEDGGIDLADHIARESSLSSGAVALATFDRAAGREPGFVHPDPDSWPDGVSLHERAPRYGRRPRTVAHSER